MTPGGTKSDAKGYFLNEFDPQQQDCVRTVYENIRWFLSEAKGSLSGPRESLGKVGG